MVDDGRISSRVPILTDSTGPCSRKDIIVECTVSVQPQTIVPFRREHGVGFGINCCQHELDCL